MEDTLLRSGFLVGAISAQELQAYLQQGDANSGPVLPPSVYLSSTRIMTPPQAIPILCQIEYTSVHVSYLWFAISAQGLQA